MAYDRLIGFDESASAGEKLPPDVRTEVQSVVPETTLTDLGITVDVSKLNATAGLIDNIQSQLNGKAPAYPILEQLGYGATVPGGGESGDIARNIGGGAWTSVAEFKEELGTMPPTNGSVTTGKFDADTLVTEAEIALAKSDLRVPTWAAVRAYADTKGGGSAGAGAATFGDVIKPTALGPYPRTHLTTYNIGTTAPTFSGGNRAYLWDTGQPFFRVGGNLVNNSSFGFNTLNTASGGLGVSSCEIEFDLIGDQCSIMFLNYGQEDIRPIVNNVAVNPYWEHFTGPNYWFMNFVFDPTKGPKVNRIRVLMPMCGLAQIIVPNSAQIVKAPPRTKILATGDSYGHGGTNMNGQISAGALPGELAFQTGCEVWNYCIGGTGFSNPGASGVNSSVYGSAARLAAYAAAPAVDFILIIGAANDGNIVTYPVANTRLAAKALWDAFGTSRPNTPIFQLGVEAGIYPAIATDLNTLNAGLAAEAAAHPKVAAYINSRVGTTYPGQWVTGSGTEDNIQRDGNADLAIGNDHAHPTHYGWGELWAKRTIKQLSTVPIPVLQAAA